MNIDQYTDVLDKIVDCYKNAMRQGDTEVMIKARSELTGLTTHAVLEQDPAKMRVMRSRLAYLSGLANHYDSTIKAGDIYRTLGAIMMTMEETSMPLQRLRLILPKTKSYTLIKYIQENQCQTEQEIYLHCMNLGSCHEVSAMLSALCNYGLVWKFTNISEDDQEEIVVTYAISELGSETLSEFE